MRILSIPEAAERANVAVKTMRDPRWRSRVGLPLTRIGRKTGVLEEDLLRLIRKGRERLLGEQLGGER